MDRLFVVLLAFCFAFGSKKLSAQTSDLEHVCYKDSIITLTFTHPADGCGSHSERLVYGRVDNKPFLLLSVVPNTVDLTHSFKIMDDLPDADTKRCFFIATPENCGSADTLYSDTVCVDQERPADLALDSVSIDLATQRVIVGWTKSISPDVAGYRVYQYSNAVFTLIDKTANTFYDMPNGSPDYTKVYGLAAFDQCENFSPFQDRHSPIVLSASFDTCSRSFNINWSSYQGWETDSYEVYHNLNHVGYKQIENAPGNSIDYSKYNPDFELGDSVCFFIRARNKDNTNVSSTSNEVCFETRALDTTTIFEIDYVSVIDDAFIEVKMNHNQSSDFSFLNIYKSETQTPLLFNSQVVATGTTNVISDLQVRVDDVSYDYFATLENKCGDIIDSTQVSTSILLNVIENAGDHQISWSAYKEWPSLVQDYKIDEAQDNGSTWNTLVSNLDPTNNYNSNPYYTTPLDELSTVCYRIEATSTTGQSAFSNTNCIEAAFKVWIPNAVNPIGELPRFKIVATGVDNNRSSYQIYNRWGQKIFSSNNINDVWDLTYLGNSITSGLYLYTVDVYGLRGEHQIFSGELLVLQ